MSPDITRLHHVGHVVGDLTEALLRYRRMGFLLAPPSYPAMPDRDGGPLRAFGATNTHADFPDNFLELATVVRDGAPAALPDGAKLVALDAPPDVLPRLVERIGETSSNLTRCLERFEGLHILMFESPDIDATAARLTSTGVPHRGVNTVRRPVPTPDGVRVEEIRYLEIDGDDRAGPSGSVPEGRIGIAAPLGPATRAGQQLDHPNGAVALAEVVLCVAGSTLDTVADRYAGYLDRPARPDGGRLVFDLGGTRLTLVTDSGLPTLLPGETPPALPALVACTIAVRDVEAARRILLGNGFPLRESAYGDIFVPATAALGAAIAFRAAPSPAPRPGAVAC
ncbi:VOC family protein [Plantactinospora sp. WMMB782]|uniref:VOC family protein n=1 Tax=Plantactinospora sp. WMMB782 TaxID=3404121 RepID=UPI003B94B1A4